MKKISAIIKPIMQDDVVFALHKIDGFPGAVIDDVLLTGGGGGTLEPRRPFGLLKGIRLDIVCADALVDDIVRTIVNQGHTGLEDDGSIVVCPAEDVWSIQNRCSVKNDKNKGKKV